MASIVAIFGSIFFAIAVLDYMIYLRREGKISYQELVLNLHNPGFTWLRTLVLQFSVLSFALGFANRVGPQWLNLDNFWLELALGFLLVDAAYYFKHYAEHNFPVFWLAHRIHHSPAEYHGLISYRFSPWAILHLLPLLSLIAFLGIHPSVILFSLATSGIYQNIGHLNFLCRPSFLDRFVQTPFVHRAHHSPDPNLHQCNFGGVFYIWDHLFGTYRSIPAEVVPTAGLAKPMEFRENLFANYSLIWSGPSQEDKIKQIVSTSRHPNTVSGT